MMTHTLSDFAMNQIRLDEEVAQDLREQNAELLEALRQISSIVKGSKPQMENQIDFARRTATEAIRKAKEA